MNKARFTLLAGLILAAATMRLLPHPHNFSPIAALALFGGSQFTDKRAAFLVPLTAMFLADIFLGLHALIPIVYGCLALIVCLGFFVKRNPTIWRIGSAALVGSILFFVVTNFAVWSFTPMYSKDLAGLSTCYLAAIPFFANTLMGDAFYNTVLFGTLALVEWQLPLFRENLVIESQA